VIDQSAAQGLSEREAYRWNLLGDLVFEDTYGFPEVLFNRDAAFSGRSPAEGRAVAAETLLDFLEREWIFLYRLDGLSPNDASELLHLRLDSTLARAHITRVSSTGLTDRYDIWIAPTDRGVAAAKDPPPAVRALWVWDD